MNILIFNWRDLKHSWAGGGEIYVFELAKRWVKMGHSVTVFCSQDPYKKLKDEEEYDGIRIIRRGGRFSLYLWAPFYYLKILRKNADLVVDVENGIPFFTPLYSRKPKVAFVYHVHGKQFFYELRFPVSHIGYLIEQYVFPLLYRGITVVAISQTTKKELERIGFKKEKIRVIYCGIEKIRSKNLVKKFASPTILYLGRIKAYKRVDLLVDLFGEILKSIPSARLIIAGWGTEASAVTDTVMKSPYRRRIDLMGPVTTKEKKKLLSHSWLFANLSIGEGWSIAVIEANLYGTPAVGFNVTGLSESIRNNITGLLVKNKQEMVQSIIKTLKNRDLREKLSRNAQKWAQTFDWDKSAKQSIKILQEVAG